MRRLAVLAAVLGLAAAVVVIVHYARETSRQAARLGRLENENRELGARSQQLAGELASLRQAPPPPREEPPPAAPAPSSDPKALEQTRLLIQLRDRLAAANSSIAQLRLRIQELEAAIEKANEENRELAASEEELKVKIASTSRVLEAVQEELKGKEQRLGHLEETNNRLREESRAAAAKIAQLPRQLRDLEELNRRRESYLGNVMRRYKEITDQFRTLPEGSGGTELARIQEAMSMAEEDLRQLASLNAQAARIQRQIAAR
jgi:chromosome segregation ATPase